MKSISAPFLAFPALFALIAMTTLLAGTPLPCLAQTSKDALQPGIVSPWPVVTVQAYLSAPELKKRYDSYHPFPKALQQLRQRAGDSMLFVVFYGSWCRDSRKNVPRLLKTADALRKQGVSVRVMLVEVDREKRLTRPMADGLERQAVDIPFTPHIEIYRDRQYIGYVSERLWRSVERHLHSVLKRYDEA